MALTAQEETALKGLVADMTPTELAAMKIAGQKQQVADLKQKWIVKKAALETASGNYLAALNDADIALAGGDATAIANAKTAIVTAKQALSAALEAAK